MGIRKVLGASGIDIITLINRDFLKLVLISLIISVPVAWYAMSSWLQTFAYRTNLGIEIFAYAGIISIVLALLTVSFKAIGVALKNPVNAIKVQ